MFNRKALYRGLAAALLCTASTSLYAETFTISLTGVIDLGEETFDNAYDLFADDVVSAVGTFTAASDFLTAASSTGMFSSIDINLNGTHFNLLSASAIPTVTFENGALFDLNYTSTAMPGLNSSGLFFDNINEVDTMVGTWTSASVTLVPEAETYAMMLAGLGLVGFMGLRRKQALAA
jgi:hypothetical protein